MGKHRGLVYTLAAIFWLFNVGLPIVIAACPMGSETLAPSCCRPNANFEGTNFTSSENYSCCTKIVAAGRNTTEFVQAKQQLPDLSKFGANYFYSGFKVAAAQDSSKPLVELCDRSPPFREDIPVFISALLI